MQPDNHPHNRDTSPLPPPPSSPPLPTVFHRHHPQPAPTAEPENPSPSLRRHFSDLQTVRINVQSPFADSESSSSRRKEGCPARWSMTVQEMKDEIARGGLGQEEKWEREGMRLVWQGRIVRDEERVGEIVGNTRDSSHVHTFHLVARRISPAIRPALIPVPPPHPEPTPTTLPPPQSSSSDSVSTMALRDSIHYLLFTARHHLCHLLSAPVLRWEEMVPPPTIEQAKAREAVMTVVRVFAEQQRDREEGWERWESAFEGDDLAGLTQQWVNLGGREVIEQEVRALWASRIGRIWKDGEEGETVTIEFDEISYQLNLPPQHLVTPYQLIHLAIYLRITSLLPLLERILEVSSRPIPTPTLPLLDYVIYRRTFRIRLPRIPTPVLSHILFSALKILAMMWMLTRDMRWNDMSLWIMGGGALGWWFGDALNRFNQERRRNPPPAPAAQPAEHGRGDGNIVANTPAQVATDAPVRAAAASRANRPRMPQVSNPLTFLIPLVHLDHDARQLHLPVSSTHRAMGDLDAFANANDPTRAARVHRQPPRWKTQLCLPVMLWLVTLFPGWEAIRARAIRRRERAMRVLVGELSAGGEPVEEGQEAPRVLPEGLSPAAKAYFKRVMERGEGIDWEEEREAQRALGVGEEEPDEGRGGLGLGM